MQFLYFLPGEGGINSTALRKYGLEEILEQNEFKPGCHIGQKGTTLCPCGEIAEKELSGALVGKPSNSDLRFNLSGQVWEEVGEKEKFWLGFHKDSPPTPSDLVHEDIVAGHYVKLGDGHDWLLPAARSFSQGSALPQNLILGPEGKLLGEVKEKYRGLFDRAVSVAAQIYSPKTAEDDGQMKFEMEPADLFRLAVDGLAVNYAIGIPEVNVLKLLDTQTLVLCVKALVDFPAFVKMVEEFGADEAKKKDSVAGS